LHFGLAMSIECQNRQGLNLCAFSFREGVRLISEAFGVELTGKKAGTCADARQILWDKVPQDDATSRKILRDEGPQANATSRLHFEFSHHLRITRRLDFHRWRLEMREARPYRYISSAARYCALAYAVSGDGAWLPVRLPMRRGRRGPRAAGYHGPDPSGILPSGPKEIGDGK
jgi:hypothetical protein